MRKVKIFLYFILGVLVIVSIYELVTFLKFKNEYDTANEKKLEYELLNKEIATYTELKNIHSDETLKLEEFEEKIKNMKEKKDGLKKEIDDLKNSISEYNKKINSFS